MTRAIDPTRRTRANRYGAIASIAVLLAGMALTLLAPPASAAPALTLSKSTDLVAGETITVSWSGFRPAIQQPVIFIQECQAGRVSDTSIECAITSLISPDNTASGSGSAPYIVRSTDPGVGGAPDPPTFQEGFVCDATHPCQITAREAFDNSDNSLIAVPVTFSTTVPTTTTVGGTTTTTVGGTTTTTLGGGTTTTTTLGGTTTTTVGGTTTTTLDSGTTTTTTVDGTTTTTTTLGDTTTTTLGDVTTTTAAGNPTTTAGQLPFTGSASRLPVLGFFGFLAVLVGAGTRAVALSPDFRPHLPGFLSGLSQLRFPRRRR